MTKHHDTRTRLPLEGSTKALRISELTRRYINAGPEEQAQIDREVEGLISGDIVPLPTKKERICGNY